MNPLEKFRTNVGLTQSDIATITGLSRQSVSAIENGMWEHFPEAIHLKLKPIAQDEFGYPWPANYLLLEARYQAARTDRRVRTRQTTPISRALSGDRRVPNPNSQLLDTAHRTGQHVFVIWRQRAVGSGVTARTFAKLIAINPEVVREYEHSKPFTAMPFALREALLDCGVDVSRLERLVSEYWAANR